jgi:hypothetical protein
VEKIYAITTKNFVILAKILEAKFGCGFAALGIIQAKGSKNIVTGICSILKGKRHDFSFRRELTGNYKALNIV